MKIYYLIFLPVFLILISSCLGTPLHRNYIPADSEQQTTKNEEVKTDTQITNVQITEAPTASQQSMTQQAQQQTLENNEKEIEKEEILPENDPPLITEETDNKIDSAPALKSIEDLVAEADCNCGGEHPHIQDILEALLTQDETPIQIAEQQPPQQTITQEETPVQPQAQEQIPAQPPIERQPTLVERQTQEQAPAQRQPVQTPVQPTQRPQQQVPVQQQQQTEIEQPQITETQQEDAQSETEFTAAERVIPPFRNEFPSAPAARIEPAEGDIVFSRVIRVTVGQIIEIPFRGNGWVYLGELASRRGVVYNSRRSDPEGMSFIFSVEEPGTFTLKFYREDFTRGYIINDYVQIIAGAAAAPGTAWFNPMIDRSRVVAEPRWPSVIEEAEMRRRLESGRAARSSETAVFTPTASQENAQQTTAPSLERTLPSQQTPQQTQQQGSATQQGNATQTPPLQTTAPVVTQTPPSQTAAPVATQTPPLQTTAPAVTQTPERTQEEAENTSPVTAVIQESISPNMLLPRAKETFDAGNAAGAIALLDQYMQHYPNGSDEAYWLLGQFYEANTPSRNILLSIDYYKRLVNEYPQSNRLNDARRRIAYLERFYINIQ